MEARKAFQNNRIAYVFLLPTMALYFLFCLAPTLFTFMFSFFAWDSFLPTTEFVGLRNFSYVLSDSYFWGALKNNLIFLVLAVFIPVAIGLYIAVLISEINRARIIYRALIFFPAIFSGTIVAFLWKWIYHPFVGLLNAALSVMGLDFLRLSWLGDKNIVLLACFIAYAWSSIGYSAVIYLAGIQGLDHQCYEAAKIEGANFRQRIMHVTLPMLRETTTFVISLRILTAMGIFDIIFNMTAGGPYFASNVISIYTYTMLNNQEMGWGTAAAVINAVIVIGIFTGFSRLRERNTE